MCSSDWRISHIRARLMPCVVYPAITLQPSSPLIVMAILFGSIVELVIRVLPSLIQNLLFCFLRCPLEPLEHCLSSLLALYKTCSPTRPILGTHRFWWHFHLASRWRTYNRADYKGYTKKCLQRKFQRAQQTRNKSQRKVWSSLKDLIRTERSWRNSISAQ